MRPFADRARREWKLPTSAQAHRLCEAAFCPYGASPETFQGRLDGVPRGAAPCPAVGKAPAPDATHGRLTGESGWGDFALLLLAPDLNRPGSRTVLPAIGGLADG